LKRWLLTHLGLSAFALGCAIVWYFPISRGGILPDPWETLFDWAGEVVSMSYLALLYVSSTSPPPRWWRE
jgi:hypothetical protein